MNELEPLAPLDALQRYSIAEACRYLRISRNHLYEHIRTGRLRVVKDGKRTYVPGSEIARRSRVD